MGERRGRPRMLVLNQYYWPGVEATANLLSQLCESLADEFETTVVTGQLTGVESPSGRSERNGVTIIRVNSTAFDRTNLALRAINYFTYLMQSLRAAVTAERPDIVLCMTDPPIIGDVAIIVARRFRVPLVVISQDVFPEIAVELKRLENPLLIGLLRTLINAYLRRADRVVAIGETMRGRLEEKGAKHDRIRVIPNWVETDKIEASSKSNLWSVRQQLDHSFVVMHSGNIGHAQDLESLVRAVTFLRDLDDLKVVVIGAGARYESLVELATRLETDKVRFLPYQDRAVLSQSLSAADIHVVGLARGLSGYVVPSRLYGVLAAGRPVIAAAETESETAQTVNRIGCGVVVPPGRPELLAAAIRSAYEGTLDLEEMGKRGRRYVEAEADRRVAVARYRSLLGELVADRR